METVPECDINALKVMEEKMQKIEDTLYGTNGNDIVSRIISKMDIDSVQNKLTTLMVIGYILVTLGIIGIFLICYFQSQLADVSELSSLL